MYFFSYNSVSSSTYLRKLLRVTLIFFCLQSGSLFPINIFYLFQIDGGINFFNQDKDKIIDKYDLDDLRNTIAPVVNARTGIIISQHWIALVGYGFARREDYDYRLNYFTGNQKVYEQRDIHNLHVQSGYFFFPYQNRYNISIEIGLGWALYRSTLNTIDNYSASSSSGLRQRSQVVTFQSHEFYLTPTVKFYRNLRKGLGLGGDIYIGLQYPMLFPSQINFPEILLGFDASIDFSYKTDEKKKTFIAEKEVKKSEEFEQELKEKSKEN